MHQEIFSIFSYWVVQAYDPEKKEFKEVFKSYGQNVANDKLVEYLKKGVCATIKHEKLPML